MRGKCLEVGVSQISGGSRTSVGGYVLEEEKEDNSAQFETSDRRTLDEVVKWLLDGGYLPSWCTACYRAGRTGDRFMELAKTGEIATYCQANAIMTLKEYLEDYARPETKAAAGAVIEAEIPKIPHEKIRNASVIRLQRIEDGERDFRF